MKILLTGATGYIGSHLLPTLVSAGHEVICCVRDKSKFNPSVSIIDHVTTIQVDFLDPQSLNQIPTDIDVAYYLMHSMSGSSNYANLELECANNFQHAISKTQVDHVIYLGGILNENNLSKHLASRKAVESTLSSGTYNFTSIRSGIVVGSGSGSFEIIRDLVEKLPVMITPKWLKTKCQPISIFDAIQFLHLTMKNTLTYNKVFDIGGPDILTYKEMLLAYARFRKLRRLIISVPVLTPRLSSYWLYLVTATSYRLAHALVSSMKIDITCRDNSLQKLLGIQPMNYVSALSIAMPELEHSYIATTKARRYKSQDQIDIPSDWIYTPTFGCVQDRKTSPIRDIATTLDRIWSIGGDTGWYYANWLWKLRALLDKMIGGIGFGIGRSDPSEINVGDKIDFWKVCFVSKKDRRLILFAEMKVPGQAWLEFQIRDNTLLQTATFRPRGILGRIYWYILLPFHAFIFRGLIKELSK
tara:strand:+ start:30179 stop:31594 length:1416 start_codon:yes stop_codon:yes gene_type:complete